MKNNWPTFTKKEIDKVSKVLSSGKVNYWTGDECRLFEQEFAEYFDSRYAIALANGTVAIDIALKALQIGKGDEVIVTSRTFIASVSSIINCGAVPKFCDICPNSQNINPENIKHLINKKTKGILCVHLAGWPCEMDEIMRISKKHNLFVIEDCAQAHGAMYKGKSVGSFGDVGCWSFCQDKIMTTLGEGGMVTTNNKKLWKKMWSIKDHGKSYDAVYKKKHPPGFRWLHESFGTNYRMTEIQGAIGRIQLKQLKSWTKKRNRNQNIIWSNCKKIKGIRVPRFNEKTSEFYHPGNVHAAYKCYIFVQPEHLKNGWNRERIVESVVKRGIPCFSGSCSEIYLEKAFEKTEFKPQKRLPNAKMLGETSIMFLVHPTLTKSEVDLTCAVFKEIMQKATK